ncbi:MAG TPA: diguanylate cyclase [Acidimicrobiales bacterium]|nr:diguanylate cyclase [Acidimicrobiales bacterium]
MTSEDTGSAFIGSGSAEALERSFIHTGQMAYLALRNDGVVVFASETAKEVTSWEPSAIVGRNALDWLHPDDAERAVLQLSELAIVGSTPGTSLFRIRRADDSFVPVEVLGSMVSDGAEPLIGLWVRNAEHQLFLEDLLLQMVSGARRADALRLVCDGIDWQAFGSSVAISWTDDGGLQQASTGLPDSLGGADPALATPWDLSRRDGVARQGTAADLGDEQRALAEELGLGAYWVEPVDWSPIHSPATITIWTSEGPRAPAIHAYGMGLARSLVELVLRWTEQAERLDQAARSDSLTGLVNHRTFYTALDESSVGGAVLYCDLDHFKPVNDRFGHSVGDGLLRAVAKRIQGSVRQIDIVGRVGGDEFAVLCNEVNEADALEIARRILQSLKEPFHVAELEREVSIDASIGVAVSSSPVTEDLLKAADRALGSAKRGGGGRVVLSGGTRASRTPPPPSP